jgi:hypothetical protein
MGYACVILGAVAVVAFMHAIIKQQMAFNQPYAQLSTEDELDYLGMADTVEHGRTAGNGGLDGCSGHDASSSSSVDPNSSGVPMTSAPGTASKSKRGQRDLGELTADERRLTAKRLMEQFGASVSRFKLFR